ncbi:MAG: hypothetical protein ABWZ98_10010 [Nakamurella sp.]
MSSYGTAFVLDIPASVDPLQVVRTLNSAPAAFFLTSAFDGKHRIAGLIDAIEQVEPIAAALFLAGSGRAAIAEDNDEYGALWVVLRLAGGPVEIVHRRYVLNADLTDDQEIADALMDLGGVDPRWADVAGPRAAAAAAAVFGVPAEPMVVAEAESVTAFEGIGVAGGSFPWWDALQLPWPDSSMGTELSPGLQ